MGALKRNAAAIKAFIEKQINTAPTELKVGIKVDNASLVDIDELDDAEPGATVEVTFTGGDDSARLVRVFEVPEAKTSIERKRDAEADIIQSLSSVTKMLVQTNADTLANMQRLAAINEGNLRASAKLLKQIRKSHKKIARLEAANGVPQEGELEKLAAMLGPERVAAIIGKLLGKGERKDHGKEHANPGSAARLDPPDPAKGSDSGSDGKDGPREAAKAPNG